MASMRQKVHDIIHAASAACAQLTGEGLEQGAESDTSVTAPIQRDMIIAIASEYGIEITPVAADDLRLKYSAIAQSGRLPFSSKASVIGWLPGIDDFNHESLSSAITESIGWAANSHFEQIKV